MKQKDFYYSTLYIYDKVLADALAEDFAKSGERSKSKYLADRLRRDLRQNRERPLIPPQTRKNFRTGYPRSNDKFPPCNPLPHLTVTEQTTYRMLLCNVYYLLDSLVYGEAFNGECPEAGLYDVPPPRLFEQLKRLKEAYRRAATLSRGFATMM